MIRLQWLKSGPEMSQSTHSTNPWQRLPLQPPYVLPEDADLLAACSATATEDTALHFDLLPEPFLGSPDAPVVLLNLNPGFSPEDVQHHLDPRFAQSSRDSLLHRPMTYPFFLLDPTITAPGNRWWTRKLGALIRQFGVDKVAQRVLCIEYFPYHSRRFGHPKLKLPSQRYSFWLARNAIERGATIVLMRSKRIWLDAVPELQSCNQIVQLSNPQSPYISPGNCRDGFERICDALSQP